MDKNVYVVPLGAKMEVKTSLNQNFDKTKSYGTSPSFSWLVYAYQISSQLEEMNYRVLATMVEGYDLLWHQMLELHMCTNSHSIKKMKHKLIAQHTRDSISVSMYKRYMMP